MCACSHRQPDSSVKPISFHITLILAEDCITGDDDCVRACVASLSRSIKLFCHVRGSAHFHPLKPVSPSHTHTLSRTTERKYCVTALLRNSRLWGCFLSWAVGRVWVRTKETCDTRRNWEVVFHGVVTRGGQTVAATHKHTEKQRPGPAVRPFAPTHKNKLIKAHTNKHSWILVFLREHNHQVTFYQPSTVYTLISLPQAELEIRLWKLKDPFPEICPSSI